MRFALAFLSLLVFVAACEQDPKEVPVTELLVRVSSEASVQSALKRVRLRTAGVKGQTWSLRTQKTYEASVLKWPIDFVLLPSSEWKSGDDLEIIVDALDDADEPLVQARVLTSFVAQQTRIVSVSLAPCADLPLGDLCESNADCYGIGCRTCVGGACAPTPLTSTDQLPTLAGDAIDAGTATVDGSDQTEPHDDATTTSLDSSTAVDAAVGTDGALSSTDASMSATSMDGGSAEASTDTGSPSPDTGTEDQVDAGPCPTGFQRNASGTCIDVDECATQNGGCPQNSQCANTAGGRECTCNTGYVKENNTCRDLCAGACDPMATCTAASGTARCSCPASYVTTDAGKTCTFDSSCSLLGCNVNATCSVAGTTRSCACKTGYSGSGTACSNVNECNVTPPVCGANSTCADTPGSYNCGCLTNYRRVGDTCVKNPCAPNPCANGGVCSESTSGTAVCACPTGYDGPTCTHNIDDCALNPCQNGGSCTDGINRRTCACGAQFMGLSCEAEICGDTIIQNTDQLAAAARCGEIRGNLQIADGGLAAIGPSDFPNLIRVTGDLQISASYATSGASPALATITFSKLQTIGGALQIANAARAGAAQTVRFLELTTVGRSGTALAQLYVIAAPSLVTLDLPKLTTVTGNVQMRPALNAFRTLNAPQLRTVNGSVEINGAAKLCNANLSGISTVTGTVVLNNLFNTPTSQLQALIRAAAGRDTQTAVYCCAGVPSSRVNCDAVDWVSYCGC